MNEQRIEVRVLAGSRAASRIATLTEAWCQELEPPLESQVYWGDTGETTEWTRSVDELCSELEKHSNWECCLSWSEPRELLSAESASLEEWAASVLDGPADYTKWSVDLVSVNYTRDGALMVGVRGWIQPDAAEERLLALAKLVGATRGCVVDDDRMFPETVADCRDWRSLLGPDIR